jgi:ATP-binding cassette subfamily C protein CydD
VRVGGVDVFSLDLRAWRRNVAFLPQRPYLGEETTTVRECMRLVVRDVPDDDMRESLARVALWEALARTVADDPLSTCVRTLSAGQKQRLALARVLCQKAPVVVLDEPDANLDRAGIELVAALVRELRGEHMVAIAAHTPELVAAADLRVTLADGRVVATATHDDLPRAKEA